ncbi:acyl carrier protein [Bacteroidota bacterium]|nr:acyl carrier protein [Bacteroidota bacterium]
MGKIKKIVLDLVKKVGDNQNITEKSLLLDEGWIDSLSTIMLLSELENKFSIEIETEELSHENFNTIENISKLILNKVEN